ncbi:tRNA pseudouridine(55) synthase TruB [Lachnospiraceae bacterium LCP25S3_G4]
MIHGVINIYKEPGFTSHDVVAKLRGIVGQKKIGHTGTLDPDATGVLPVCLGKATKLCDMLTDRDKSYRAVMRLGVETDTQDISGKIQKETSIDALTIEQMIGCIQDYTGAYYQIPPMYSALKVNGKKLYELARAGKVVERTPRKVLIHGIEILDISLPRITLDIQCSKGTYIRTLCHDIGQTLGCGACMEQLTRTKVGNFLLEDSYTLTQIEDMKRDGTLLKHIIPIDAMFMDYKATRIEKSYVSLVYNGNEFKKSYLAQPDIFHADEFVRVYDDLGNFIAIYRYDSEQEIFRIKKMFFDKNEVS